MDWESSNWRWEGVIGGGQLDGGLNGGNWRKGGDGDWMEANGGGQLEGGNWMEANGGSNWRGQLEGGGD